MSIYKEKIEKTSKKTTFEGGGGCAKLTCQKKSLF